MWARTYFFTDTMAFNMRETMYKVQATMEISILNTDPGIWTWEQRDIYAESQAFSVVMWDMIYAKDIHPESMMWDPLSKCFVHVEMFFMEHGVTAEPEFNVELDIDDGLSFVYSDDSSHITFVIRNINDLEEVTVLSDQSDLENSAAVLNLDNVIVDLTNFDWDTGIEDLE